MLFSAVWSGFSLQLSVFLIIPLSMPLRNSAGSVDRMQSVCRCLSVGNQLNIDFSVLQLREWVCLLVMKTPYEQVSKSTPGF